MTYTYAYDARLGALVDQSVEVAKRVQRMEVKVSVGRGRCNTKVAFVRK